AAAKLFLIGDALGGNKPEDLTVAECFAGAHDCRNIHLPVFLYRARSTLVKSFLRCKTGSRTKRCPNGPCRIRTGFGMGTGFSGQGKVTYQAADNYQMTTPCKVPGCKSAAPAALEEQQLCVLHYTLSLEASCAAKRRWETRRMSGRRRFCGI